MPRTMLAVQQRAADYLRPELVTEARSLEEAKEMIIRAEEIGQPFDDLDLPVRNEKQFWAFIEWMRKRGRIVSRLFRKISFDRSVTGSQPACVSFGSASISRM